MSPPANLPALLQAFFTDRLMRQRKASPHTIASYRDTFRLLFEFSQRRLKTSPSHLRLEDLDAPRIGAFLDELQQKRGNGPRTRNVRLAAIRSFFRYVALQEPGYSDLIQRVLAMPNQRCGRNTSTEIDALLAAPDRDTWSGRRDGTLLLLMVQTGLRVSEVTGLRCEDIVLGTGAHVRCRGKGRKERCTPLRRDALKALRRWLRERNASPIEPLFPNARGGPLSRDGVAYLLAKHVTAARRRCPSLACKRVSPHVLRHSMAMELLDHGVDRSVIALWLGHESAETTQMYLHASLEFLIMPKHTAPLARDPPDSRRIP
jgi:site-specific recombinase XerD